MSSSSHSSGSIYDVEFLITDVSVRFLDVVVVCAVSHEFIDKQAFFCVVINRFIVPYKEFVRYSSIEIGPK